MRLALIASIATLVLAAGQAAAGTVVVSVDGHSGPWNQTLNPTMTYGYDDNLDPTSVTNGFDFTAGGHFTISYVSGLTDPYGDNNPYADAGGDTAYVADNNPGSSGNFFPSFYVDGSTYPVYLNELIGAFADASGVVIGNPFAIGNGPYDAVAPVGAARLLFGVNDDIFGDNSGALRISVSGPGGAVPEPASWALMIGGFGAAGAMLRRRRVAATA